MSKAIHVLITASVALAACAPSAQVEPAVPPTSAPSATSVSTTTPRPSPTPNPFPNPVLKITGAEEVVYDWTTDRCEDLNLPDMAVRAFRNAQGQAQLWISHFINYRMIGPDLNNLKPDCKPVMRSATDADPSMFTDYEWLASPYTLDGNTVYALTHNEYQGHMHPGQCPQKSYFPCMDVSLTMAISTDGGATFAPIQPPPGHLVARLPYPYEAGKGPDGTRNPSNIVRGPDGYFYSIFNVSMWGTQSQSVCMMRTDNLADPAAWRFWTGSDFEGQFVDTYRDPSATIFGHVCAPLDPDGQTVGATLNDSLTYNTYLKQYVLMGLSADSLDGKEVLGIYYAFSDDLLHWKRRKLLEEAPLPWTVGNPGSDLSLLYPSLLDPASDSPNFETVGKTAYVYYTRMNHGQSSLDRDLVRVPVEFFPKP